MSCVLDILLTHADRNSVYKVETVKDSFVGVSGAPERVTQLKNDVQIIIMRTRANIRK